MLGEGLVLRLGFLLLFIIAIISAASLTNTTETTNNGLRGANMECAVVASSCVYGSCKGGTCNPCPHNPLLCCPNEVGTCTSAGGAAYGACTSPCSW